ncbi:xanthine dehydrogenase [Dorcoceras hygrometricum]|uniref:Xanthine dehydrogenase n=1 Tax=Dorcoceras hygrometricum TaxID=472368 RepID=A0A2Z7DAG1_9LAMI|nr:xanthine dehydrogenase [Dorcoceras hygrometricum]
MQHAINQCHECMRAIKESDSETSPSTGKSNQASIPRTANQPVEIIAARLTTSITACSRLKLLRAAQFVPQSHNFYLTDYSKHDRTHGRRNQLSPGSKIHGSRLPGTEICASLNPQEKRTAQISPKASNASNSTLPDSALIQGLKWVAIERAKLGEFNATKIIKNKGWKRRESAMESYGEQ